MKHRLITLAVVLGMSVSLAAGVANGAQAAQTKPKNSAMAISGGIAEKPVGKAGETFATYTESVKYSVGQTVTLAGDPRGTAVYTIDGYSGNVYVDDAMDITVTHADGTMTNWTNEWTFECFGLYPSGPLNISGLFQPGQNKVRISLRDECGTDEGSSPLYFTGNAGFSRGPATDPAGLATFGNGGWLAKQVTPGAGQGFQAIKYDDSKWPADEAPFSGEFNGSHVIEPCPAWDSNYGTGWTARTKDLLIRRHLTFPLKLDKAIITGDLEGTATVYVNGKKVQQVTNTSCRQLTIRATVPGSDLSGGDNVLAVRVSGTGTGSKRHGFVDLQVAYVPAYSNPPPDYVALGDSYTSGEGLDPYQDGSNTNGNTCHRSKTQAYPELMADRDSGLALEFHACSGATTGDYKNPNPDQSGPPERAQRDWLSAGTALISMTFGVDDLSWTNAIQDCLKFEVGPTHKPVYQQTSACLSDLNGVQQQIGTPGSSALEQSLIALYTQALIDAPNAQIRVLGYPEAFPSRSTKAGGCVLTGLPATYQVVFANNVEDEAKTLELKLDAVIQDAVTTVRAASPANSRLAYVDTGQTFGGADGHTISCGDAHRPKPWINALSFTTDGAKRVVADLEGRHWKKLMDDVEEFVIPSFHPKSAGQQELADALAASLPK